MGGALPGAPILDRLARKERDPRRDEVIEEQISRAGPGTLPSGPDEVNRVVGTLRQENQRPRPGVSNTVTDERARKLVKQRISSRGLVDGEIHLPARLQYSEVFLKSPERFFCVMNYTVGNHQVRAAIHKWEMQVVAHDPGPPVAFLREVERNAATIESDASNSALCEKAEHATRTATHIDDHCIRIHRLNQIRERRRNDGANVRRSVRRRPIERMLIVKRDRFSGSHFSLPMPARSLLPFSPLAYSNLTVPQRPG